MNEKEKAKIEVKARYSAQLPEILSYCCSFVIYSRNWAVGKGFGFFFLTMLGYAFLATLD
jgi:hypothetical protein